MEPVSVEMKRKTELVDMEMKRKMELVGVEAMRKLVQANGGVTKIPIVLQVWEDY